MSRFYWGNIERERVNEISQALSLYSTRHRDSGEGFNSSGLADWAQLLWSHPPGLKISMSQTGWNCLKIENMLNNGFIGFKGCGRAGVLFYCLSQNRQQKEWINQDASNSWTCTWYWEWITRMHPFAARLFLLSRVLFITKSMGYFYKTNTSFPRENHYNHGIFL